MATAAGTDEASTTVSCSFDFAVASLHSTATAAVAATGALRNSEACYYSPEVADRSLPMSVAVGGQQGLSTIELAVRRADHRSQNLDSKACPNELPNSATSKCRP